MRTSPSLKTARGDANGPEPLVRRPDSVHVHTPCPHRRDDELFADDDEEGGVLHPTA